jgi:acyl-CoA oxidase
VFGVHDLLNHSISLHQSGYFNKSHAQLLRKYYEQCLADMRPHALNLIESYLHTDNNLNSCIGNYYGDIYEQQLDWAKNSKLNKRTEPLPGFDKYMKPFYTSKL